MKRKIPVLLAALLFVSLLLLFLRSENDDGAAMSLQAHPRPAGADAVAALEPALFEDDRQQKAEMSECLKNVVELRRDGHRGADTGFFYETRHRVILDDGVLFSYETSYQIFCGGAYPHFGTAGASLSVPDKGHYEVTRLYRLTEDRLGSMSFLRDEIREMILSRLVREAVAGPDAARGCAIMLKRDGLERHYMPEFVLAESGIMVFSSEPKVVSACYPPVLLPYDRVRPYLDEAEARRLKWNR